MAEEEKEYVQVQLNALNLHFSSNEDEGFQSHPSWTRRVLRRDFKGGRKIASRRGFGERFRHEGQQGRRGEKNLWEAEVKVTGRDILRH